MSSWIPIVAAAATGFVVSAVQRSRVAATLFAAGAMALGVAIIAFEHADAARAARPDAELDGARLADFARQHVVCKHATFHCPRAAESDGALHVPFSCGNTTTVQANFYGSRVECSQLRPTVAGYLLDMNEAGGGEPAWELQVDAPRTTFPGFLSFAGAGLVLSGLASKRLFAWSARRMANARG